MSAPQRLRCNDDGFWRYEVRLDGERILCWTEADAERGVVSFYVPGPNGVVDLGKQKPLTVRGKVEIVRKERT